MAEDFNGVFKVILGGAAIATLGAAIAGAATVGPYSCGPSTIVGLPGAGLSYGIGQIFRARAHYFTNHPDKTNADRKYKNATEHARRCHAAGKFFLWGLIPVVGPTIGIVTLIKGRLTKDSHAF